MMDDDGVPWILTCKRMRERDEKERGRKLVAVSEMKGRVNRLKGLGMWFLGNCSLVLKFWVGFLRVLEGSGRVAIE